MGLSPLIFTATVAVLPAAVTVIVASPATPPVTSPAASTGATVSRSVGELRGRGQVADDAAVLLFDDEKLLCAVRPTEADIGRINAQVCGRGERRGHAHSSAMRGESVSKVHGVSGGAGDLNEPRPQGSGEGCPLPCGRGSLESDF